LGARSAERGQKAVDDIKAAIPEAADKLELMLIDVSDDKSVTDAAAAFKAKGITLYALANNAGVGLSTGAPDEEILAANFYGPKRVTDAFVDMIEEGGRIVVTSSSAGAMWLAK
jgi:NAD(P)-dependent dehydrogenase (short-subunit alcohol dehydrogenase family)